MQDDDFENPAMVLVDEASELWGKWTARQAKPAHLVTMMRHLP